nr:hypothetical protein [Herbaspirillum sp. ASV7]
MSNIPQLRQAVKLMLDVMPNSPIFSAIQVNDLIVDLEGAAAKPQDLESSIAGLVAGVVLTQEQVDIILRLTDSASNDGSHEERNLATGVLHCAKCGLHAALIGRACQQAKEEGCPNGCGPLWPMTWEQHVQKLETINKEMEFELEAMQACQPQNGGGGGAAGEPGAGTEPLKFAAITRIQRRFRKIDQRAVYQIIRETEYVHGIRPRRPPEEST